MSENVTVEIDHSVTPGDVDFVEIGLAVVPGGREAVLAHLILVREQPTPSGAMFLGTAKIVDGKLIQPERPLELEAQFLPPLQALLEIAEQTVEHLDYDVGGLAMLAGEEGRGELAVLAARAAPGSGGEHLAFVCWQGPQGTVHVPLEHLPIIGRVVGQARAALAAMGLDPAARSRLN